MEKNRTTNLLILTALIMAVAGITIGYAALQTTFDIQGTATMQTATWDIAFENLSAPVLTGAASEATAPTLSDTLIGTYSVLVTKPGDSVTYTFDVTNDGDLDAQIGTFTKAANPTCTGVAGVPAQATADAALVCANLTYTLTYTVGGAVVNVGDTLTAGQTKNLTLALSYSGSSLPTDDVNITGLNISMIYIED